MYSSSITDCCLILFYLLFFFFFFFKQKTAYEMRIIDWSSDVCSSDLGHGAGWSWLDSCAVAGTQELAGPACGSVGDRREGTVRGYRKARHVRAHVGLQ